MNTTTIEFDPRNIETLGARRFDNTIAQSFVDACNECERVCFETANHCLTQGGSLADVRAIQLLRNCARICRTSLASWKVGSALYSQVLSSCLRVCEQAAALCDKAAGDRQLRECAEECRACADVCRLMSETSVGAPLALGEVA